MPPRTNKWRYKWCLFYFFFLFFLSFLNLSMHTTMMNRIVYGANDLFSGVLFLANLLARTRWKCEFIYSFHRKQEHFVFQPLPHNGNFFHFDEYLSNYPIIRANASLFEKCWSRYITNASFHATVNGAHTPVFHLSIHCTSSLFIIALQFTFCAPSSI